MEEKSSKTRKYKKIKKGLKKQKMEAEGSKI